MVEWVRTQSWFTIIRVRYFYLKNTEEQIKFSWNVSILSSHTIKIVINWLGSQSLGIRQTII